MDTAIYFRTLERVNLPILKIKNWTDVVVWFARVAVCGLSQSRRQAVRQTFQHCHRLRSSHDSRAGTALRQEHIRQIERGLTAQLVDGLWRSNTKVRRKGEAQGRSLIWANQFLTETRATKGMSGKGGGGARLNGGQSGSYSGR